jgi:hypothetical protein
MNYGEYATRLKRYGVSIRNGESIMVTKIKVKNKHIEFQLGGGGYGTIGDETSTGVSVPSVGKSRRERRLEDEIKEEPDPRRKRRLREELDDLRRDREREDRRNQAIAAEAEESKRARIEQKALQGGSRFNIKFDSNINPAALNPQSIMRALEKFVDFSEVGDKYSTNLRRLDQSSKPTVFLKTGLSPAEVIAFLGEPEEKFERTEGETLVRTYVFVRKEGRVIEADFIGGSLVRSRTFQREWRGTQAMTANK